MSSQPDTAEQEATRGPQPHRCNARVEDVIQVTCPDVWRVPGGHDAALQRRNAHPFLDSGHRCLSKAATAALILSGAVIVCGRGAAEEVAPGAGCCLAVCALGRRVSSIGNDRVADAAVTVAGTKLLQLRCCLGACSASHACCNLKEDTGVTPCCYVGNGIMGNPLRDVDGDLRSATQAGADRAVPGADDPREVQCAHEAQAQAHLHP